MSKLKSGAGKWLFNQRAGRAEGRREGFSRQREPLVPPDFVPLFDKPYWLSDASGNRGFTRSWDGRGPQQNTVRVEESDGFASLRAVFAD